MQLIAKLSGLSPQENDAYLKEVWLQFIGTEAHEALTLAINEIMDEAKAALLAPRTDAMERAHAAGQVCAVERLRSTIKAAASFDPASAQYITEPDDDYAPDDGQII